MEILFATSNSKKVEEIAALLGDDFSLKGLADIACTEEIPETTDTIEGNAIQKARYVYDNYGVDCFAEDTGLEVFALDMAPGVDTAYYAGPARDPDKNMDLLLHNLASKDNRQAQFRTVIAFVKNGEVQTFEGICKGSIAAEKEGEKGFGYDPIFIPEGEQRTFAQMTQEEKSQVSHRARALAAFLAYLKNN